MFGRVFVYNKEKLVGEPNYQGPYMIRASCKVSFCPAVLSLSQTLSGSLVTYRDLGLASDLCTSSRVGSRWFQEVALMSKRSHVAPKTSWNLMEASFTRKVILVAPPWGSSVSLVQCMLSVPTHECPLRELNTVRPRSALHKSSFINRQDRKGPIQMTPKRGP